MCMKVHMCFMQVWSFSPWVQEQLDPVLEELAQMPAPRMGFHIRGGDKLSEDVQLVGLMMVLSDRSSDPV